MRKIYFLEILADVFHIFSTQGRQRILYDLIDSTSENNNHMSVDSQNFINSNDFLFIENRIYQKFSNKSFIDLEVEWHFTLGDDHFSESELKKGSLIVSKYLSFLENDTKYFLFVKLFKRKLLENKSLLELI